MDVSPLNDGGARGGFLLMADEVEGVEEDDV